MTGVKAPQDDPTDEFITVSREDARKISQREGFVPVSQYKGHAVAREFGRIDERRYLLSEADAVVGTPVQNTRGDEDDIQPGDEKVFVTLADLKRFRRRTLDDLNRLIGPAGFQGEMIGMQTRLALIWNGVNAILRAFMRKSMVVSKTYIEGFTTAPLLTAEDVKSAGEELAKEAKANMAAAQRAIAEKRKLEPEERTPVPLEEFREVLIQRRSPEETPAADEQKTSDAPSEKGDVDASR